MFWSNKYSRTPLNREIQYNAIVPWTPFFQLKNTKSQENHKNKSQSMYKNYKIPDLDVPLTCQRKAFTLLRQSIVIAACSGKLLIPLTRYVNKAAILIIAFI